MIRTLLASAALLAAAPALADEPTTATTVFSTVDAFERTADSNFTIVGIVSGESAARSLDFNGSSSILHATDACERAALLMMNRPGRFTLQVKVRLLNDFEPWTCRLVRQ
jgi:hypothetical protein